MDLIPAKNHAESFEAVIRNLQQTQSDYEYLREGITKTIELLNFLRNEVVAPPQWFVISLHALILIVANETYFGRANDIRLKAWVSKDGRYNFTELAPSSEGNVLVFIDKNVVSFDDKIKAKQYLETFFNQ